MMAQFIVVLFYIVSFLLFSWGLKHIIDTTKKDSFCPKCGCRLIRKEKTTTEKSVHINMKRFLGDAQVTYSYWECPNCEYRRY